MVTVRSFPWGPVAYGFAWAGAAPALLLWWAMATEDVVTLPAVYSPLVGAMLGVGGLTLMALGMNALRVHGDGLPMNAYPPPRYVARGVYGWVSHPIYVGFILLAAGVSIGAGSASGLWLVTPAAALGLAALVLGYEAHDLRRRFGARVQPPRLSLPGTAEGAPGAWERVSVYVLVLLPWLLAYQAAQFFGVPAVYGSTYLLILAAPLLISSRPALRRFAVTGLLATGAVVAAPGAFPLFHVLWPLLAADALGRSRGRVWGTVAFSYAVLITFSYTTTGVHALADVLFALVLFPVFRQYDRVWDTLRRGAELVANSWREWRIGPVRLLNHGFYTAIGGALGAWIAGRLAGPDLFYWVVVVSLAALLASMLWAQYLEGSSVLLRPLGWYGGLLGGLLAVVGLALSGVQVLPLLGALAVATPWVQAFGRLRCLVQGCCHGAPTSPLHGIRYYHPRSRVAKLADLAGVPLYPTPLYSVLANVVTGVLLYRLWVLGASPTLVAGVYLLLSSAARFVEESYRAEPQTPVVARLRLYQWLAAAGFLAGMAVTGLPSPPVPAPLPAADWRLAVGALLVGLIGWFITGVDFPGSNRRFSRLAPGDEVTRD